ncbi:META domain-containing protein [Mycobacterium hubeiense]|uniref:META domain-containing protein n=1 Tax=Mycobacterium hubeiense TaxID=1867256 RepID=UPI000C7F6766|nr:META domain-containing protein [Mycobacterium sp. QGD 101]
MRLLLPVVATVLALASCAGSGTAEAQTPAGRTFISVKVDGAQIPGGGPLEVAFEDGRISAYAGCNRGSGPVDLADGRVVTQLATTMMACPPPLDAADAWMTKLFEARPSWTLDGDTLTLTTDAATVTLRDKKVVNPDRALTGTHWIVHSLVSSEAVMTSVDLEQARPSLTIAADGAVTGSTGCNQFNGRATFSEGSIDFGPLATTKRACPGELAEIEQSVLRVLSGRVQATIDADELRLNRDDGYGLILRAQ